MPDPAVKKTSRWPASVRVLAHRNFLSCQHGVSASTIARMALLLGLLNALEAPLRQALIARFVPDPVDLPNALVQKIKLTTELPV